MTLTRPRKSARSLDRFNSPEFIRRLKDRDEYAFHELNLLLPFITSYIFNRYKQNEYPLSVEDAEDIAQETMFIINRGIQSGRYTEREKAKFTTWIFRIARNLAFDRHEQLKRRKETPLGEFSVEKTSRASLGAREERKRAGGRNMDRAMAANLNDPAERLGIEEALRSLESKYRNVLIWSYLDGYTPEEIAQRMGVRVNTVHQWLARARKQFQRAYAKL
ncbi:MAG: RNA polymerase sigma factor [Acidobacteriota bacterium]|nr:RNA polymerase sigma factor [Acidobacteriota bacterium]